MGQPNPHQPVRLLKAETTRRALLKDRDLMAEENDLRLLSTGPKRGGDQSQKSDEKWSHRGNNDGTDGPKTCIFNPYGVFGIHTRPECILQTCAIA